MSFEKQVKLLCQRVGTDESKVIRAKDELQSEHESLVQKVGTVLADAAKLPSNDVLLRRWCRKVLFPKKLVIG